MKKIGWIGLGNMGRPMAFNLLRAGYELYVFNRSKDKAADLIEAGAILTDSPAELARRSEIIVTMVSNASAVEAVLNGDEGVLSAIQPHQVVIDMSTIAPEDSRQFAQSVRARGAEFLDAPVSGSVKPATEGTLVVLVGGSQHIFETCRPIFDVLGKRSIYFGEIGRGSSAKLVINLLLGFTVHGISECLLLADQTGLGREQVFDMITESAVNTPLFQMKKELYRSEQFPAAFALKHMTKDLGLALSAAKQAQIDLPAAATISNLFKSAMAEGKGELDVAAIYLQLKEKAANEHE